VAAKGTAHEAGAADPRHAQGAIAKARAAETRHPERATAAEACAAPGKAYPTAAPRKPDMPAKTSAMAAKAAAVPPETSATAACIGFKRERSGTRRSNIAATQALPATCGRTA
jgi:hypothetical protein